MYGSCKQVWIDVNWRTVYKNKRTDSSSHDNAQNAKDVATLIQIPLKSRDDYIS